MLTGDYAMAVAGCREAIEIGSKDLTDDDRRWHHARLQGWLAALEGRFEDAIRHHTEQLSHGREGGYVQREGQSLTDLARMQLVADEVDVAVENLRKATDSAAETGQTDLHLQAALLLSEAERRQGGYASARARLRSLVEATTVWKVPHSIELVEVVARLAASTDHLGIAVKLAGAAQAAREQTGMPALPHGSANRSLLEEAIRRMDELDEVWREGSALTLDEARAEAFVYLGA